MDESSIYVCMRLHVSHRRCETMEGCCFITHLYRQFFISQFGHSEGVNVVIVCRFVFIKTIRKTDFASFRFHSRSMLFFIRTIPLTNTFDFSITSGFSLFSCDHSIVTSECVHESVVRIIWRSHWTTKTTMAASTTTTAAAAVIQSRLA